MNNPDIPRSGIRQKDLGRRIQIGIRADAPESIRGQGFPNGFLSRIFRFQKRLAHTDPGHVETFLGPEETLEPRLILAEGIEEHPSSDVGPRIIVYGRIKVSA